LIDLPLMQSVCPNGLSEGAVSAQLSRLLAEHARQISELSAEQNRQASAPLAGRTLQNVLLIPPDFTRANSGAGHIVRILWKLLAGCRVDILPALGTHAPMSRGQQIEFFGPDIPADAFLTHDWRTGIVTLGQVPAEAVWEISGGLMDQAIPVQLAAPVVKGRYDLILSIGQVVPHEVAGMANYTKNLVVGCGGSAFISASHMLGAMVGAEHIMGRADNPVRRLFDYAQQHFLKDLPLAYVLTVTAPVSGESVEVCAHGTADCAESTCENQPVDACPKATYEGQLTAACAQAACDVIAEKSPSCAMRAGEKPLHAAPFDAPEGDAPCRVLGLYTSSGRDGFEAAAAHAARANITQVARPIHTCVVYLDASEFHSTWLGNKAVYRTRMALARDARLIVLAPGVCRFGEDDENDRLIRKYGYAGRAQVIEWLKTQPDLRESLSVAAHLIHGSHDDAFSVTYAAPKLTPDEVQKAGYRYGPSELLARYAPEHLTPGWNTLPDDEEIYFIQNPALGLWKFEASDD